MFEDKALAVSKGKINSAKMCLLEELEQAKEAVGYFQKFLPYVSCIKDEPSLMLDNLRFAHEQSQKLMQCLQRSEKTAEVMLEATEELEKLVNVSESETI